MNAYSVDVNVTHNCRVKVDSPCGLSVISNCAMNGIGLIDSASESDDDVNIPRHMRTFLPRVNLGGFDFVERFRLSRRAMRYLENRIGLQLRRRTRRNFALTPRQQVLIAMRFFAVGR